MASEKELDAILVDLDGVLANFLYGALGAFGRVDLYDNWPIGQWNISTVLGISTNDFWTRIMSFGHEFWEALPAYPWTMELWEILSTITNDQGAQLAICTAPSRSSDCAKGKVMWMQKIFGKTFMDYVITQKKNLLAGPKTVLIDDREDNVIKFSAEGGVGILFPGRTNAYGILPTTDIVMATIVEPILRGISGEPLEEMFPYRNPECDDRFNVFFKKMQKAIFEGII
jgi:hypothetical protein